MGCFYEYIILVICMSMYEFLVFLKMIKYWVYKGIKINNS